MKFLFTILIPALLLFCCSCHRKVATQKSHTTKHQDSNSVSIDTTKMVQNEVEQITTYYGDTLNGTINIIPDEPDVNGFVSKNSFESNGIKLNVDLKPTKTGFKAHVTAIAKPVAVTNTKAKETTEAKGNSNIIHVRTDQESEAKNKASESENEIWKFLGLGLSIIAILLLIAFVIWLYFKNKGNG